MRARHQALVNHRFPAPVDDGDRGIQRTRRTLLVGVCGVLQARTHPEQGTSKCRLAPRRSPAYSFARGGNMAIRIFRVIMPVADIEHAARYYGSLLDQAGMRVSSG